MASTHYQDATQPQNSSQPAEYVKQQQQQKAMQQQQQQQQQSDARTAKRIKVEHGEENSSSSQSKNGQASQQFPPLVLPTSRQNSQQMGPPLSSRPSTLNQNSYSSGDAASPAAAQSTGNSPSPQPSQSGPSRVNVGPGRMPYQFGAGLPTPGINFTRTPTTGSFLVGGGNGSNNNSRQHTPTEQGRTVSRASPGEASKASGSNAGPSASRKDGVDQLQDLLSISGVDLRAEEEAAQRTPIARASYQSANIAAAGQASIAPQLSQSPFYLEIYPLSRRIHEIASKQGLRVDPAVLNYLSQAAKIRFQNLLEAMIASSRHRTWSSYLRSPPLYENSGQSMYHEEIHDDPLKLLAALTKVEKRQEQDARQARILKEEREANDTGIGQGDEGEGVSSGQATPAERSREGAGEDSKKKGKKLGVAATARNMSEDKRLKLANKTAAQALGINPNTKAWMLGGTSSGSNPPFGGKSGLNAVGGSRLPKPRFAPTTTPGADENTGEIVQGVEGGTGQEGSGVGGGSSSFRSNSISVGGWGDLAARQRLKEEEEKLAKNRVNLQDALHALDMERSGGAGRGSGETILYQTRVLGRPPSRQRKV